ncbi:MAG TPA: hypothetical protein VMT76_10700 [Puia sp.]|nr:hypothetical protein [Puia sp.]
MKRIIILSLMFCLTSAAFHLHAQTINNRNWKTFIADPLNDTLVFHIRADSSFVTNGTGMAVLHTNCIITGDTLTLSDYGTGDYTCPDMRGKYKIHLNGNSFMLTVIEDPCEGRVHALDGIKWTEEK